MKGKEYRKIKRLKDVLRMNNKVKEIRCKFYKCDGKTFRNRTKLAEYLGVTSWAISKWERKYDINLTYKTETTYIYRGHKITAFR